MKEDLHVNDKNWVEFGQKGTTEKEDCKKNGWNSPASQDMRFGIFADEIQYEDNGILDIGCGTGDFYKYMKSWGILEEIRYVGYDLSEDMIRTARDRYPDEGGISPVFKVKDILDNDFDHMTTFDVVVASGIFSERKFKSLEYLDKMIGQMFKLSGRVVAFNLLSTFGDEIKEGSRYWSPSEVIMIISKYTHNFKILHDYAPHDFSVVMYKQ